MSSPHPSPTPLSPAVFHVLLSLADGPLHGYAVMKRVEEDSGLAMGPGTVYGALQRLTEAGWVDERAVEDPDPRRTRAFGLTPAGIEALRQEARRMQRLTSLNRIQALLDARAVEG